jgi:hypothetical protein
MLSLDVPTLQRGKWCSAALDGACIVVWCGTEAGSAPQSPGTCYIVVVRQMRNYLALPGRIEVRTQRWNGDVAAAAPSYPTATQGIRHRCITRLLITDMPLDADRGQQRG